MTEPGTDDALVEVPVHAAVLRATADLLDLLGEFFTDADPGTRTRLGTYLVDRYGQRTPLTRSPKPRSRSQS